MKITNHSGAWAAEIEILEGPMSALCLEIGIFCRNRQRARRTFTIGQALASGKYPEGLAEVETWLEKTAGSAELKHKVLAAVAVAILRTEVSTYDWFLMAEIVGQEKPFGKEFEEGYRVEVPQRLLPSSWTGEAKFGNLEAAVAYANDQADNLEALEIVHEDKWGNRTPIALVKPASILCLHGEVHYLAKRLSFDLETIERWVVRHWGLKEGFETHLEDLEDLKAEIWSYSRLTAHWGMRVCPALGWDTDWQPQEEEL